MDAKIRQQAISKILMKAWRERWTDYKFGIEIKQALPKIRLPADALVLTDLILQQTLIGAGVNKLLLSYLKHSLYSQLISFPAVITRTAQYNQFEKYFCIKALLDFLISIMDGVTCRGKADETALMGSFLLLVQWLIEMTERLFTKIKAANNVPTKGKHELNNLPVFLFSIFNLSEQEQCLEKISTLSHQIVQNQFLIGILYLAKLEDRETYEKCIIGFKKIQSWNKQAVVKDLYQMLFVKLDHISMKEVEARTVEPITFCLQPFISIEVLVHSSAETSVHVSKLLMIQKLKHYSMARLYCEVIRSCFITLCHVKEVSYRVWGAFFLYKVPLILKQLHLQTKNVDEKLDYSEDIVKCFEMLLEGTPILDLLDTTFQCNSIKCILVELLKLNLINEENGKRLVEKREASIAKLEKFNIATTPPPINEFVVTIDPTLHGLISSLRDTIKPEFVQLLGSLLVDNRAYLLYSVAGVKGKHKTMISGLLKCNDSCKEVSGEVTKSKQSVTFRANTFDTSFILLYSIMLKCGADNFPELSGDSFFETWVRDVMVDPTKSKSPMAIVKICDQSKVDEMIGYFSDNSNQQQLPISFRWNEICMNIPAMLYNVLIAWENETIQPTVVKSILDNMRSKMCCFAVVAASWLCAYIKILHEDEQSKPKVMVQQLMKPLDEATMKQEMFTERLTLTHEVIAKLYDTRSSTDCLHKSTSQKPLNDLFNEQWSEIQSKKWLHFDVATNLEQLFKSCGAFWMMKNLVDQILKCKFIKEMETTMDIAFAIMHLNIESCTEALLREILPIMLLNNNQ